MTRRRDAHSFQHFRNLKSFFLIAVLYDVVRCHLRWRSRKYPSYLMSYETSFEIGKHAISNCVWMYQSLRNYRDPTAVDYLNNIHLVNSHFTNSLKCTYVCWVLRLRYGWVGGPLYLILSAVDEPFHPFRFSVYRRKDGDGDVQLLCLPEELTP